MTQINVVKQKYAFVPQLCRYYKSEADDRNDSGSTTYNEMEDKCAQIGTDQYIMILSA